jgi:hypothetical protein
LRRRAAFALLRAAHGRPALAWKCAPPPPPPLLPSRPPHHTFHLCASAISHHLRRFMRRALAGHVQQRLLYAALRARGPA